MKDDYFKRHRAKRRKENISGFIVWVVFSLLIGFVCYVIVGLFM